MVLFCQQCGAKTNKQIPDLDHQLRDVCSQCGFIHYQNPQVISGALITYQNKILLCKRAIEPSYGRWTLPAGYLEIGETMQQGAIRESLEEAHANIQIEQLYCLHNLTHVGHIYVLFKAQLIDGQFAPSPESLECKLFSLDEIPWQELAFPAIYRTIELYRNDVNLPELPLHIEDFDSERSQYFYQNLLNMP